MRPLRVVIGDSHPPTREVTRRALEPADIEVCAEAATADDTVAAVEEHRPDVALVDVNLPGDGVRAAWEIGERVPETKVVILTRSTEDEHLFDALQAGAVGYLLKDSDPSHLPNTLAAVLRGELALPRSLVARVVTEFRARGRQRHRPLMGKKSDRLTEREWQVLEMLAEGMSTAEIADGLYVTSVTVRTHIAAVLRKLKVPDRAAAIQLMRES